MQDIHTRGPIKIAYDEPSTGTREGFGAVAAIILTIGEPEGTDVLPGSVLMMTKHAAQAQTMLTTLILNIDHHFGPKAVQDAIDAAILLRDNKPIILERRIEANPRPPKGPNTI